MKKTKSRKPRNWNAVNAQFRKAGSMKDKRKKRVDQKEKEQILEDLFEKHEDCDCGSCRPWTY